MKPTKLSDIPPRGAYQARQPVELEILAETDLGYRAVVDDHYTGVLYRSELSGPLQIGQYLKGWIKAVRPDGKLDLTITQLDDESRSELEESILRYLQRKGGVAPISDRSTPEQIQQLFGCSKASFKRAIGRLFKQQRIVIGDAGIRLTEAPEGAAAGGSARAPSPWDRKKEG